MCGGEQGWASGQQLRAEGAGGVQVSEDDMSFIIYIIPNLFIHKAAEYNQNHNYTNEHKYCSGTI